MQMDIRRHIYSLPDNLLRLIREIGELSAECGYEAYLVGGFVRDLILGVKNLDLDITVVGDGLELANRLSAKLKASIIRHRRFGTATVILPDRIKIDIATARREFYEKPTSLPKVEAGSIKDDLKRRDFAINAMAISINPDTFARMVDFFAGQEALHDKKIRILHDLSFIDDPTRILRAVRFEQRFKFRIEKHTLRLLKDSVSSGMLDMVHPHRLRDEIILILKEENPLRYIKRLEALTKFNFICKGLRLNTNKVNFLNSVSRTISWFENKMSQKRQLDKWIMYFIGLIANLEMEQIKAICRKFAFVRGDNIRIRSYKKVSSGLTKKLKIRQAPSMIYRLLEPLSYEVILLIKSGSKNKVLQQNINDFFIAYNGSKIHITGNDLAELGIPSGPSYKKILKKILYAKLDKEINTREDELAFLKKLVVR